MTNSNLPELNKFQASRSRWISMFFVRLRCETILSPIYIERRRVLFCIEWQWMEIFKALRYIQLICGWLVNALLFQVRERVNIYMTDMPENINLCELRSTFYIRPEIHNSSKCYLTLAELAWKKRKSRPALMWVSMRTIHLVNSRPLQMIYGMHDISRVYTVD